MNLKQLWTDEGLLCTPGDGGSSTRFPVRLRTRITVPGRRTIWETAAMVELSGRIGLHVTHLPAPVFNQMFLFDELDRRYTLRALHLVVGAGTDWLQRVMAGYNIKPLIDRMTLAGGHQEEGLLYWLEDTSSSMSATVEEDCKEQDFTRYFLVVTGTSPVAALRAVRYLVTDGFGLGFDEFDDLGLMVIPSRPMNATKSPDSVTSGFSRGLSLHNLFTEEGIYRLTPDAPDPECDIVFDVQHSGGYETQAYVELAARVGLSAAALHFPLVRCCEEAIPASTGLILQLNPDENWREGKICVELMDNGTIPFLSVRANPKMLLCTVRWMNGNWFEPPDGSDHWRSRFAALTSTHPDISKRACLGVMAWGSMYEGKEQASGFGAHRVQLPEHLARPLDLWQEYLEPPKIYGSNAGVPKRSPVQIDIAKQPPVWTVDWQDDGELADLERYILEYTGRLRGEEACNGLQGFEECKDLAIEVTTSVSPQTFAVWSSQLRSRIQGKMRRVPRFIYRDANKSGLNWARSDVLPKLEQMTGIHRIVLQARAFRPEKPHLDMVHRFLQELYPFDALASEALQIPLDSVELELMDERAPMFRIAALAKDGSQLGEWSWDGWVQSFLYMPENPGMGYVAVPAAGCRILEMAGPGGNGETHAKIRVVDASEPIMTNACRFWKWYQAQFLPGLIDRMGDSAGSPKFLRLDCHVHLDAVDIPLGFQEEVSSTLEALQEDIYFYTLHYFHEYGKRADDLNWGAPGAVIPWVHSAPGESPRAQASLYMLPPEDYLKLVDDSRPPQMPPSVREFYAETELFAEAAITGIRFQDGKIGFALQGIADEQASLWCRNWLANARDGVALPRYGDASSPVAGEICEGEPAGGERAVNKGGLTGVKGWADRVLANADVAEALRSETCLAGAATRLDFSLEGEWIWLVELYGGRSASEITDCMKHRLYKPTIFIAGRHHANEVSSTNSALRLIQEINLAPQVLNKVNVVLVPLENVDGANLHAKLAAEHPRWKHHPARYNACGLEFARWRFQAGAPFGESRIYQKVWQRWRPDVVLDDHGVPSHEWIQPFSGYGSPPQFSVSYWIPQARMYTIWRRITSASGEHQAAFESLRTYVTKHLNMDPEIQSGNALWLKMYQRWGNRFVPEQFPVELVNGNLAFVRDSATNESSPDLIERFSQWVTADIVTEVNDETAVGRQLAACVHAHSVVHKALLDWILRSRSEVAARQEILPGGRVRVGLHRQRPLSDPSAS